MDTVSIIFYWHAMNEIWNSTCQGNALAGNQVNLRYAQPVAECQGGSSAHWYFTLTFQNQTTIKVTGLNQTQGSLYTPSENKTCNEMLNDTTELQTKMAMFRVNNYPRVNSSRLLVFISGPKNFRVVTNCSCQPMVDGCTPQFSDDEESSKPGWSILIIGATMMSISIMLIFMVVISVCCIIKKYKRTSKKEESKNMKSSMGDTYEVIKDSDVWSAPYSKANAANGTADSEPIRNRLVSAGNESKRSGKSNTLERSSERPPSSVYSIADGVSEKEVEGFDNPQENYDVISETQEATTPIKVAQCKVATPFLLAHSSGSFTLPQLRSVAQKVSNAAKSEDDSASLAESEPGGEAVGPGDQPESNYNVLDRSGRSRSIDLCAVGEYDDVVGVRGTKRPQRQQHCKTADVVPSGEKVFDFALKCFSENMYSLQRNLDNKDSNNDELESEEHIYEAYDRDDQSSIASSPTQRVNLSPKPEPGHDSPSYTESPKKDAPEGNRLSDDILTSEISPRHEQTPSPTIESASPSPYERSALSEASEESSSSDDSLSTGPDSDASETQSPAIDNTVYEELLPESEFQEDEPTETSHSEKYAPPSSHLSEIFVPDVVFPSDDAKKETPSRQNATNGGSELPMSPTNDTTRRPVSEDASALVPAPPTPTAVAGPERHVTFASLPDTDSGDDYDDSGSDT